MELIRAKKPKLSIDLAPLIDVVFQLLVFFMLTSTFTNPAIKMVLPKAVTGDYNAERHVTVSIDQGGNIFINGKSTDLKRFRSDLREVLVEEGEHSIHIRGDADMPYRTFIRIMDLARQAGAGQINIVHQKQ